MSPMERPRTPAASVSGTYACVGELAPDLGRPTLLIVDDDDDLRGLVRDQLHAIGYDVIEARDGADALAQLRAAVRLPTAILTDLAMPRLDGWEFVGAVRGDDRWSGIPIIVISASTHPPAGIPCLSKPVGRGRLIQALADVGAALPTVA